VSFWAGLNLLTSLLGCSFLVSVHLPPSLYNLSSSLHYCVCVPNHLVRDWPVLLPAFSEIHTFPSFFSNAHFHLIWLVSVLTSICFNRNLFLVSKGRFSLIHFNTHLFLAVSASTSSMMADASVHATVWHRVICSCYIPVYSVMSAVLCFMCETCSCDVVYVRIWCVLMLLLSFWFDCWPQISVAAINGCRERIQFSLSLLTVNVSLDHKTSFCLYQRQC